MQRKTKPEKKQYSSRHSKHKMVAYPSGKKGRKLSERELERYYLAKYDK